MPNWTYSFEFMQCAYFLQLLSHFFVRFLMRRMTILKEIEGTRSSEALDAALRRLTSQCRNTWTGARSTELHCAVLCSTLLYSLSSAILHSSFSFLFFPFHFLIPSFFHSPFSFILRHVTLASMNQKQTSRMKVFSFRTLF